MSKIKFFQKEWFIYGLLAMAIFELSTLFSYTYVILNWFMLIIVVIGVLWLVYRDLRWALYLPLVELILGSFGRALSWQLFTFDISLRELLFVLCLFVWLIKSLPVKNLDIIKFVRHNQLYVNLLLAIGWGIVIGIVKGNPVADIFFDANGYLYVLYYIVWSKVFTQKCIGPIFSLLFAAAVLLSVKTLGIFYIFVHEIHLLNPTFMYIWIRDTRIGEITYAGNGLWRIFFQSHLYLGLAFLTYMIMMGNRLFQKKYLYLLPVPILIMSGLIISQSRSVWLALFVSLAVSVLFLARSCKISQPRILQPLLSVAAVIVISTILVYSMATIPSTGAQFGSAFSQRVSSLGTEAAGASRLSLLQPLSTAILQAPIIGHGFGKSLTYHSADPRYKNPLNPEGLHTTYAFEWGYLDQWLKLGAVGFMAILLIILTQFYQGIKLALVYPHARLFLHILLAGLLFVSITHVLSPYLNHPLGLGYLLLTMVAIKSISQSHDNEKSYN